MNIVLVCNLGVSTSLLVESMKKYLPEGSKVEAIPVGDIEDRINEFDIVMIGPQVAFREKRIREIAEKNGKAAGLIDPRNYGRNNGDLIVKHAQEILGTGK